MTRSAKATAALPRRSTTTLTKLQTNSDITTGPGRPWSRHPLIHLAVLVSLLSIASSGFAASYTFTPIVFPGTTLTVAFGINNVGEMIVGEYGCCTLPLANNAFLLAGGTLTTLPNFPGAEATNATAINDTGDIVGIYLLGGVQHGFLLSGGQFTTIDFPGTTLNQVFGVNNAGQIVGESTDTNAPSFLFSGGNFTPIKIPGASDTAARGINDSGQIVGFYSPTPGTVRGFRLSGGTFTTIVVPGATNTYVFGTNNLGDIVGHYDGHGFLLSDGTFTTIDAPGFTNTTLYGINDAGDMVGQAYNGNQLETIGLLVSTTHATLSITVAGSGIGSVTGAPGVIACPPLCSEAYRSGATITLTATPASGSGFAGWSGDAACATGVVTLEADASCTATFNLADIAPSTTITGGPSGTIAVNGATFTWTGSDDVTPVGNLVYAFRLAPLESSFSAFASATSKTYTALPNGSYTFYVKAKDLAGNEDATPASQTFTVLLGRDLVEISVTDPPTTIRKGHKFPVTDIVQNQGGIATKISTTRYYLDADWTPDKRLVGMHSVPGLQPGATYTKTVTVAVPSSTFPGLYRLMVCSDDKGTVAESIETNNCLASVATVQVTP